MRTASRSTSGTFVRSRFASRVRALAARVAITAVTKPAPPTHKGPPDDTSGAAQLHKLNSIAGLPYASNDARRAFCCLGGAVQFRCSANVRFWHKADITRLSFNVRFWGKADIPARCAECLLLTQSGHERLRI